MKKRITSWLLMLILVLGLLPAAVSAAPKTGGSGTEADPYQIRKEKAFPVSFQQLLIPGQTSGALTMDDRVTRKE